jgi:hypothetical protein
MAYVYLIKIDKLLDHLIKAMSAMPNKKILKIHGRKPVPMSVERMLQLDYLREQAHAKARARRVGKPNQQELLGARLPIIVDSREYVTCYQRGCNNIVNNGLFRYCRDCR